MVLQFNRRELVLLVGFAPSTIVALGRPSRVRVNSGGPASTPQDVIARINRNDVNVIVMADANSRDATAEVADIAGCRFMALPPALSAPVCAPRPPACGRPGSCSCEPARSSSQAGLRRWTGSSMRPNCRGGGPRAVFRPPGAVDPMRPGIAELWSLLRVALGAGPRPEQGLLIAKRFTRRSAATPIAPTQRPPC